MCLALPMRITAIEGSLATIAAEGLEQRASLALVPQARVGDYVLVHAGYAINVIDEAEAQETLALLAELSEFAAGEGGEADDAG
jgi:hydrogenase expression/formation protein HypC